MAGQAALESNASSGARITPGACKIALIVISPGAFNSFWQRAHRVVIRAGKIDIERELAWCGSSRCELTDDDVGASARNAFVDRLANLRFERKPGSRGEIDHNVRSVSDSPN